MVYKWFPKLQYSPTIRSILQETEKWEEVPYVRASMHLYQDPDLLDGPITEAPSRRSQHNQEFSSPPLPSHSGEIEFSGNLIYFIAPRENEICTLREVTNTDDGEIMCMTSDLYLSVLYI